MQQPPIECNPVDISQGQSLPWKALLVVAIAGGLLGFLIGSTALLMGVVLSAGIFALALPMVRPVEALYLLFFLLTLTTA